MNLIRETCFINHCAFDGQSQTPNGGGSQATFLDLRMGRSPAKNDVAEVDSRISVVVLIVVIQIVNGDVKESWPQQRESDVELGGSIRKRFGERRTCVGDDGIRAGLGTIAKVKSCVFQGLLAADAFDPISAAGLKLRRGAGDGSNLDGVVRTERSFDFRFNAKRVLSCLSCCAAVLDVWRHPVKVNAAVMHAMAMMICFFMICNGCRVLCWSARSAAQRQRYATAAGSKGGA